MPKKDRDSSDSSSEDSTSSRSSSPSPRSRSEKKKKDKISSSRNNNRKSRKSYKHRDDKKKKHRRSSNSSESRDSRSRSRSRSKSASRSKHRNRYRRSKSRDRAQKTRDRPVREQEPPKKKAPSPEAVVPSKTEEEIQNEKERKRQIRLAKLRAIKYEQDDEAPEQTSPQMAPITQEPEVTYNDTFEDSNRLVDELEKDDDDKQSKQETPVMKPMNSAMEEEEIDPLDAYMNEIDQVAKQQVLESWNQGMEATGREIVEEKVDQSKVITFEDFEHLYQAPASKMANGNSQKDTIEEEKQSSNNILNSSVYIAEEEVEEDRFHKEFIKAMRKKKDAIVPEAPKETKENDKAKKKAQDKSGKGEIMDDDIEDEYMAFREDTEADQDFLTKQKKMAEKKELKHIDHSEIEYQPFRKSFYIEPREIANMTAAEVEEYRKELGDIQVRGRDCPKPIKNWYQCGLSDTMLTLITEKKKFESPFPIQCQAIPAIMTGRDVIGVAETGSGKTLAYVLPMIRHIKDQRPLAEGDGPIGLIMAPTRELAWQIYQECKAFTKVVGLNVACVYGGAGVQGQIADLKRGVEIVVCTPGRMIDVLSTSNGKVTNLRRVTFVVLDEADRMLDFGFQPQIERIMSNVRSDKQTAMFSATFPRNVETLAKKVLVRPIEIIVGSRGKISANVEQIIEVVNDDSKFLRLLKYLGEWSEKGSILIFVNKQTDADNLFKELLKFAYYALVLHGGQDPDDRENTISDFKKGIRTLMVATSVCARGLDIKSLVLVVNYQCPQHKEDYVHRIGRTGRAGNKGTAVTFITPEEDQYAFDIITALKMSNIEPPADLVELSEGYKNKVEKGEAKFYTNKNLQGTGFGFNKAESDRVKETKRALKKQFGLELDMSDNEDEEIVIGKESERDKDNIVDEAQIKKMLKDANTRTAVTRAAEQAAKDAILAGGGAEEVLQAAHNAIKSILGQYKGSGLENAAKIVGQIEEREDELNERVSTDLEINDYPQSARNKVTHRDFLTMLHDLTNCSVSVRGTYIEPGKKNTHGLKKLRLHIVGENKYEVESAFREIRKILDDTAAQSMNTVGGQGGKFTI